MEDTEISQLSFNAHYIECFEINGDTASHCKLRSKLVHEKLFKSRIKDSVYPVVLLISKLGVKVVNAHDQVVLSSHSMQRISYSACDRLNRLFALAFRSCGVKKGQQCYIFRMDNSEQADSANRYFGSIFKQLHEQKKAKKMHQDVEQVPTNPEKYVNMSELLSSLDGAECIQAGGEPNVDFRLRRISSSNVEELVSEKHNIRRHSLCLMTAGSDDGDLTGADIAPVISNVTRPMVRPKKPDQKVNRLSAAIERWSFRASRDISTDLFKSGSPVVALKEQIEYEELVSIGSSAGSGSRRVHCPNVGPVSLPDSTKQTVPSTIHLDNDARTKKNNNDSRDNIVSRFLRKNSAPLCRPMSTGDEDEQAPVPPVRIHSLRCTAGPRTPSIEDESHRVRGRGEGASQTMQLGGGDSSDEDDLSSITTPSSCGHPELEVAKLYDEAALTSSSKLCREAEAPSRYSCPPKETLTARSSSTPIPYFRNVNKEEAMCQLLDQEIGGFLLRYSGSQRGCLALSVKVATDLVSHYIIEQTAGGLRMKGLDKQWPDLQALITHLSVMPEMLPCPIKVCKTSAPASYLTAGLARDCATPGTRNYRQRPPQSQSAADEYQHRMRHFLGDLSPPSAVGIPPGHSQDQYQQLSDFSSIIAGLDFA